MKSFELQNINTILNGVLFNNSEVEFSTIITDSRKISDFRNSLFIAIAGEQHDGHKYIQELYEKGVRCFILSKDVDYQKYTEAGFIKVSNTISALQLLASFKRNNFDIPIIGITGSNGKTIVKDWLYHILSPSLKITRSPKSYNSQIGVPLSLWLLNSETELGIFEAGISQTKEMALLERIIKPSIGILTNIGTAHQVNFTSFEEKAAEKAILFRNCETIIYNADCEVSSSQLLKLIDKKHISWSENNKGQVHIRKIIKKDELCEISLETNNTDFFFTIPFTDQGSIYNAITCFCSILALDIEPEVKILKRFESLPTIKMRLETIDAIHNSILINDSYNSDINSLEIALDYLNQKKANKKTFLIMSDILQSSEKESDLYSFISKIIKAKEISKFIGIGEALCNNKHLFPKDSNFYTNTDEFLNNIVYSDYQETAILLKAARSFKFEKISNKLQSKAHETVIEIDLNQMKSNLLYFKSLLKPETKMMVMVKAFSYGSGYQEVASLLQHNRIDYLAVAFSDEGVELRNGGIETPIMVMNPNSHSFKTMIEYNLEPEIYSISILQDLVTELSNTIISEFPIHIKLDTGMHRLGLTETEIDEFCAIINSSTKIKILSVFSHLAGSDNQDFDNFSKEQANVYLNMYDKICKLTKSAPKRHLLNSSGMIRFPQYHFDMVRLGIGLYGLMPDLADNLIPVSKFKSIISQIHYVKKGDSVSYNQSGKVNKDSIIATIPVGYADGLDRRLGNGNWQFIINSKIAKTIGDICMDMCMIDITNIVANEGDEVIIFDINNSIHKMAKALNTIPYEIVTRISQRVKRIYFEE